MGLMHVYSLFVHYHFEFSGDLKLGHDFFDKEEIDQIVLKML